MVNSKALKNGYQAASTLFRLDLGLTGLAFSYVPAFLSPSVLCSEGIFILRNMKYFMFHIAG